jgi:hypothetical protein
MTLPTQSVCTRSAARAAHPPTPAPSSRFVWAWAIVIISLFVKAKNECQAGQDYLWV